MKSVDLNEENDRGFRGLTRIGLSGNPRQSAKSAVSLRVLFLTFILVALTGCAKPEPLPKYWAIPDFKLTERSGDSFDSASLKGKVWVADFFFAKCPGVCPMLNGRMAEVHRQFAAALDGS